MNANDARVSEAEWLMVICPHGIYEKVFTIHFLQKWLINRFSRFPPRIYLYFSIFIYCVLTMTNIYMLNETAYYTNCRELKHVSYACMHFQNLNTHYKSKKLSNCRISTTYCQVLPLWWSKSIIYSILFGFQGFFEKLVWGIYSYGTWYCLFCIRLIFIAIICKGSQGKTDYNN